jgi:predicted DCC family thiol-disulfide oxidoreductase YuxK
MKRIIVFDGVCNFCNFWVNFLLERDRKNIFLFTALQSDAAKSLLKKYNRSPNDIDTFLLITDKGCFDRSTAGLLVAKELGGMWKLLYVFMIIPKFIRDPFYNLIAKNRYKFFGKNEACRIPTADERDKFLV